MIMDGISLVDQTTAQKIDEELMSEETRGLNFSIDQLMELAGLGVALCIYDYKPPPARILVISGKKGRHHSFNSCLHNRARE